MVIFGLTLLSFWSSSLSAASCPSAIFKIKLLLLLLPTQAALGTEVIQKLSATE